VFSLCQLGGGYAEEDTATIVQFRVFGDFLQKMTTGQTANDTRLREFGVRLTTVQYTSYEYTQHCYESSLSHARKYLAEVDADRFHLKQDDITRLRALPPDTVAVSMTFAESKDLFGHAVRLIHTAPSVLFVLMDESCFAYLNSAITQFAIYPNTKLKSVQDCAVKLRTNFLLRLPDEEDDKAFAAPLAQMVASLHLDVFTTHHDPLLKKDLVKVDWIKLLFAVLKVPTLCSNYREFVRDPNPSSSSSSQMTVTSAPSSQELDTEAVSSDLPRAREILRYALLKYVHQDNFWAVHRATYAWKCEEVKCNCTCACTCTARVRVHYTINHEAYSLLCDKKFGKEFSAVTEGFSVGSAHLPKFSLYMRHVMRYLVSIYLPAKVCDSTSVDWELVRRFKVPTYEPPTTPRFAALFKIRLFHGNDLLAVYSHSEDGKLVQEPPPPVASASPVIQPHVENGTEVQPPPLVPSASPADPAILLLASAAPPGILDPVQPSPLVPSASPADPAILLLASGAPPAILDPLLLPDESDILNSITDPKGSSEFYAAFLAAVTLLQGAERNVQEIDESEEDTDESDEEEGKQGDSEEDDDPEVEEPEDDLDDDSNVQIVSVAATQPENDQQRSLDLQKCKQNNCALLLRSIVLVSCTLLIISNRAFSCMETEQLLGRLHNGHIHACGAMLGA
jgi:hypothetical protein